MQYTNVYVNNITQYNNNLQMYKMRYRHNKTLKINIIST